MCWIGLPVRNIGFTKYFLINICCVVILICSFLSLSDPQLCPKSLNKSHTLTSWILDQGLCTYQKVMRFDWLKISSWSPRVHSINCLRNEFAFDSNFVMTQLRSSNFLDSSQACFCSAFMQEKMELIGRNLQFIGLNNKMETLINQKLIREAAYDTSMKEQVDCHTHVYRLENSCQCLACRGGWGHSDMWGYSDIDFILLLVNNSYKKSNQNR